MVGTNICKVHTYKGILGHNVPHTAVYYKNNSGICRQGEFSTLAKAKTNKQNFFCDRMIKKKIK
jgi:hypothetical protein